MSVIGDNTGTCSHVTNDITFRINYDFIKVEFLHLRGDRLDMSLLVGALTGVCHNRAQERGHILSITFSSFLNLLVIHSHVKISFPDYLFVDINITVQSVLRNAKVLGDFVA